MKPLKGPLKPGWYPFGSGRTGTPYKHWWRWCDGDQISYPAGDWNKREQVSGIASIRSLYAHRVAIYPQPAWYQKWLRERGLPVGGEA